MRILHYYNPNDPMVSQHVKMLTEGMAPEVESHQATESEQAKTLLQGGQYNILHLHGCWRNSSRTIVSLALRQGARLVVTPHGQLEPWVKEENYWREKLPKTLLYQRDILRKAYAVIIQGRMEQECMNQLEWNPRTVVIRNAVVTSSITPKEMARQTLQVYRKVMDSNTLALMSDDTKTMMSLLLKAGITGDKRWISEALPTIDETEWRKLLVYADHENVRTVVDLGARVLGVHHPYIETSQIKSYLPTSYKLPKVSAHDVIGIVAEMRREPLTLRHFVALDQALRRDNVDDDRLTDTLDENNQLKYFRRLLYILTELTRLDEGFWPDVPIDDRGTQALRNQLNKHLRI